MQKEPFLLYRPFRNMLPLITAGAALLATTGPLTGQTGPQRVFTELPTEVQVTDVQVADIRMPAPNYGIDQPGGGEITGSGCVQGATHTDASFEGGSYIAQAGFAQGEIAAAEYVIPASAFPIQIVSAEMIFVTSQATIPTTTHWSVLFWSGPPNTGTLVAQYSSDDKLLPHLRVGPGDDGANLFFAVDSEDPEQIIINASPSNSFTVGFRIDRHQQQTANPCFTAPPSCCNAFPTTDVGGLAQPSLNWLFGLNCGPFGCPPNGGWVRFSQLATFCRPSGDWVLRVRWRSVACQPGVGACCLPSGLCEQRTTGACASAGGIYQGDGSNCATVTCPQPIGACCFQSTGGCLDLQSGQCAAAGGIYQGNGTRCVTTVCFPIGACCLFDGTCLSPVSPEECQALSGTFRGNGTNCATTICPLPTGSCCFSTGFCLELTQADCTSVGATWGGAGTVCSQPVFSQQPQGAAVCTGEGVTLSASACGTAPLTYQWRRNQQPTGDTGPVLVIDQVTPATAGTYDVIVTASGGGSRTSDAAVVTLTQSCDSNCDGNVDFDDISAFVTALVSQAQWEAAHGCDYLCANDADGDGAVTFSDIGPFVTCLIGG